MFRKGRGKGHERDWSDDGDAFLVLARAVGLASRVIGRMMGWPKKVTAAQLTALLRGGEVPVLAARYGLEVEYDVERERFPGLARAMERFAAGERLSSEQVGCVQGVLWSWAAYYLGVDHELVRRLQVGLGRASVRRRRSRLGKLYLRLQEEGIDLLSEGM